MQAHSVVPVILWGLSLLISNVIAFQPTSIRQSLSRAANTRLFNTWSNGQAIKEYQDFLASGNQDIPMKDDVPSLVVAPSTGDPSSWDLVAAVIALGAGEDVVIQPGTSLPAEVGNSTSFPIYICVEPSELENFLDNLPADWKAKQSDFVFFSGSKKCGCIEPILKRRGLARDSMTQVLAAFSMPGPTGKPQDLSVKIGVDASGEDKWAGEAAVCGEWQGAFAERLERNGIRCRTGFYREWRRWMWERAAYDAAFNLIGAVRSEPTKMKDVALYYDEEVSDMLWEISGALRGHLAVTLSYGFEERVFGVGENAEDEACELTEEMYPFLYDNALLNSKMLVQYLNFAKDELGMLSNIELPISRLDKPSLMRQGNLRADGAI